MIDFHTHILPAIDDGSRSVEMSAAMIKRLEEQGVTDIVLSPHFYASQNSIGKFLEKRDKSVAALSEYMSGANVNIRFHLGAEILFMDSIDRVEGLENLSIGKTKYLLLEMPFVKWGARTLDTVYKLICDGYTPIIAHFERYIPIQGKMDDIYELKRQGCILQMNAESFNGFFNKRRSIRFFASETASLIGTDCHNSSTRPPEIKHAYDAVAQRLGASAVQRIDSVGRMILKESEYITF